MQRASIAAFAALAVLAGCAKPASKIAAVSLPSGLYAGLDCTALAAERATVEAKLSEASKRQNQAAATDIAMVVLVGVPISGLTGDSEGEVAGLKGQQNAIYGEQIVKSCAAPPPAPPPRPRPEATARAGGE